MTAWARMQKNRFLVLGRAGMDLYADPPGTELDKADHFYACLGGSSGNIAAALARQGAAVSMVSVVSADAVGRFACNELRKYGVDTTHVRVEEGAAQTNLALVDTRGDATEAVIYRNGAADLQLTCQDVEAVDYSAYGALVVTGTALSTEPSRSAVLRAFDLARSSDVPVVFDIDYRKSAWASARAAEKVYARAGRMADVVVGNDEEFGFMAGSADRGFACARHLAHASASIVVYKMGGKGAITLTQDTELKTGVFSVDALKPTGAGDAFMGGFLAALAVGRPLYDSILRGTAAAAIVVSRVGCAPAMPTSDEIEELVSRHPEPSVRLRGAASAYSPI